MPIVRRDAGVDSQLQSLADYIARDNPMAGERFMIAAEAAFQKLAEMPGMGSSWESDNPKLVKLRYWTIHRFENYVIIYQPIRVAFSCSMYSKERATSNPF